MIRRIVERLGKNKYFKRRLPREFGGAVLYVTPDAALKYLKLGDAAFDRGLLLVAKDFVQEGDVVWDIGANVGSFSFAAATKAGAKGHVLSVEADIWLAGLIRKSASLEQNRDLPIDVLPAAVAEKPGVATFVIAAHGRASNALETTASRTQAGGVRERQLVPTVTLDQLLETTRPPQLVKIDVEGAEIMVLAGGARLLSEVRPLVYCEVGEAENDVIAEIFWQADYVLLDPAKPSGQRTPLNKCLFNTLACPKEKAAKLGVELAVS